MGEHFAVKLTDLDDLSARLLGLIGFVEDNLSEVERRVEAAEGYWVGETTDSFTAAHQRWRSAAREMSEGVAAMREAAQSAHLSYTGALVENLKLLGRG